MPILTFHPEAEKDYQESFLWYENQEKNLGERFGQAITDTLKRIESKPELFHIVRQNFREASVSVFPYTIVYRFNKRKDTVLIVSIFHAKRNPKKKFRK